MTKREAAFALALCASGAAVTHGVALLSRPVAWIVAGGLFAAWTWLVISE